MKALLRATPEHPEGRWEPHSQGTQGKMQPSTGAGEDGPAAATAGMPLALRALEIPPGDRELLVHFPQR